MNNNTISNVTDSTKNSLETIRQFEMKSYTNSSENYSIALVPDEVKDICPELTGVMNVGGEFYYLKDEKLIFYLVDAIKRLDTRIVTLENEITTLKASK